MFALFCQAQPPPGYTLRTLTSHLNDTVVAMIDQIIPATDTPGAKGARVNEFIDVILTEWATPEERKNFLDGLAGIDKQSQSLYGKNFADASAEQQLVQLRAIDDEVLSNRVVRPRHGNTVPKPDTQLDGNFWEVFKRITVHGYYTSEVGFTQELKLQIIPGAQHGCNPVGSGNGVACPSEKNVKALMQLSLVRESPADGLPRNSPKGSTRSLSSGRPITPRQTTWNTFRSRAKYALDTAKKRQKLQPGTRCYYVFDEFSNKIFRQGFRKSLQQRP